MSAPNIDRPPSPFWVNLALELGYTSGQLICKVCGSSAGAVNQIKAAIWLRDGWPTHCYEVVVWDRGKV